MIMIFYMSKRLKPLVMCVFLVLAVTGVLSTLIETNLWSVSKIVRSNIIRLHVSWSVISCVVIGMVIEEHVRKVIKYKTSAKKIIGIILLILFCLMILTSFIIRHIKTPIVHSAAVTIHWVFGIIMICIFILHFFIRKKT